MKKVFIKKNIRYKYNRNYVNKLANKRLPFSRTSYIDYYDEVTPETLSKKTFNKLLRILNKFIGSDYAKTIDYMRTFFLKREDFDYFLKCFFCKKGDSPRNGKFYCKNDKLYYFTRKRWHNNEINIFTKSQLVFNENVKTNSIGLVYNIDNVKTKNNNYFKIKYLGNFYVLINGNVELRKVYHVPFLDIGYYNGSYFEGNKGVYSKVHGSGNDYLVYKKGSTEYNRFKAVVDQFKPVKIYTTFGEVDYFSNFYYNKKIFNEKTGETYDVVYNLGFGKLNLAIYNK